VEQSVPAGHPGLKRSSGRGRLRKRLPPYLLALPGGLWLIALFLVPLFSMLSLSLQTGDPITGIFHFQWPGNWEVFPQQISLYNVQFVRSLAFATAATVIDLLIAYPLAYWIAFHAGRKKNFFLLVLLLPFFVSFVIRTLAWQFILSDEGFVFGTLKSLHVVPEGFHVLATSTAVIAGMAYNFLPFAALPLYVSLEKIDPRMVEAAKDLYAGRAQAFIRVILPLTIPGIFAAVLLTFVPAVGDYINATILGGTNTTMIGNIIQSQFLFNSDYPAASALSAILMTGVLIGIFLYARLLGSRTIEEYI
jgi:spermidine/putrescine transport system permease protein